MMQLKELCCLREGEELKIKKFELKNFLNEKFLLTYLRKYLKEKFFTLIKHFKEVNGIYFTQKKFYY